MGSLVAGARSEDGPLAALADAAPLYDVGAATLLVGFGVLVASGLILVACEAR